MKFVNTISILIVVPNFGNQTAIIFYIWTIKNNLVIITEKICEEQIYSMRTLFFATSSEKNCDFIGSNLFNIMQLPILATNDVNI